MDNIEIMSKLIYDFMTKEQKIQLYKDMIHTVRDNTICKSRYVKFNNESLNIIENFLKEELDNDYFNPEVKQVIETRILILNKNLELYKNKYLDISIKKI